MPHVTPLLSIELPALTPVHRGKVRDIFDAGDGLVFVATDRISAFDYVLGGGIPDKGRVLTQLSAFWFARTEPIVENHLLSLDVAEYPEPFARFADVLSGRSMYVTKTTPIPIECVARGYLSGSAWKEYQQAGVVCGVALPPGLRESDRLPAPIFTPATKAQSGHDINISAEHAADVIGHDLVHRLERLTLELYAHGAQYAASRGILLADTKFEFGLTPAGDVLLIDEVMTPDSSRYWPRESWEPGHAQPAFDKQFVRDYLESIRWNKQPPVPVLPDDVIAKTREKYIEAFTRLTGQELL